MIFFALQGRSNCCSAYFKIKIDVSCFATLFPISGATDDLIDPFLPAARADGIGITFLYPPLPSSNLNLNLLARAFGQPHGCARLSTHASTCYGASLRGTLKKNSTYI
jgi:hypothetical protein